MLPSLCFAVFGAQLKDVTPQVVASQLCISGALKVSGKLARLLLYILGSNLNQ